MNPRYPFAMPAHDHKDYPWAIHTSFRVEHWNGPCRLFVMNNYLEGMLEAHGNSTFMIVERNHILGWHYHGVLVPYSSLSGEIYVRHNVIHAYGGICVSPPSPPGLPTGKHHFTNNLLDGVRNSIHLSGEGPKDQQWVPKNVQIRNNILQSRDGGGIYVPAKDWAAVKDSWQLGHNCFLNEPKGIGDPAGVDALPKQATDLIRKEPFLSIDPKHPDYLRIAADSPIATGGVGGNLPSYIGPLPPGPAPKDGDWFTRLRAVK